jgi:hypothetical protein
MEPAPGLKGDQETERSLVNDSLLGNGGGNSQIHRGLDARNVNP